MLPETRKTGLEKNIWKFYLYRFFTSLIFIEPIFVLFLQDNGLSMSEVMWLQAAYYLLVVALIVPAGVIADHIGTKKVLVANAVFFAVGWFVYAGGTGFWTFLAAEVILAASGSMWEASGSPFVYDTMRELDRESEFKRKYGRIMGVTHLMWALGALAGGFIALHSFRLTFVVTGIACMIALFVTLSFTPTRIYKHADKHYLTHLKEAVMFTARHPRIRLFIVYSSIIWGVFLSAVFFYQPYLQEAGIPLLYFGVIYFALDIVAGISSSLSDDIEKFLGERKILMIILGIMITTYACMAYGFVSLAFMFPVILSLGTGMVEPVINDYINKHVESHHRATVISLQKFSGHLAIAILAPIFGWAADMWSISVAFAMAAGLLLIDLFILISAFTAIRRKEST
ncbi:MFS transporter [Candidatus Woesearchaeota archaeon]|nr:MFS transporter [Candidatus Woesearchaeota archaeon]